MPRIEEEGVWLESLDLDDKLRFLARLSFEITIVGRNSYEAGTNELIAQAELRRINEIQHRVTACLSQLLNGTCPDGFVPSLAQWVLDEKDAELVPYLRGAWSEAKHKLLNQH
jgi:hypothetical protein